MINNVINFYIYILSYLFIEITVVVKKWQENVSYTIMINLLNNEAWTMLVLQELDKEWP